MHDNRKEARLAGDKFYSTGNPCKHGHVAKRYTSGGACIKCRAAEGSSYRENYRGEIADRSKLYRKENKEKVSEKGKKYRKENKEKVSEYQKKYRKENKEKGSEKGKVYYRENRESVLTRTNQHHKDNREKRNADKRVYYLENKEDMDSKGREHYKEHKETYAARHKKYNQENPHIAAGCKIRRVRAELNATPNWLSESDRKKIKLIYLLRNSRTAWKGVEHHVDHIVPLQGENVCGLHVPWNLQVIPAEQNLRKSNTHA